MTSTEPQASAARTTAPQDHLQAMLGVLDRAPLQLVTELADAREAALDGARLPALDEQELAFLERQARRPNAGEALRRAVAEARRAELAARQVELLAAAPGDAAALFDLAELRAELRLQGLGEEARQLTPRIEARVDAVCDTGAPAADPECAPEALVQEARERYAALATEEEDLTLHHKVLLLEETASLLHGLGARTRDRRLSGMARRLRRAAADRMLARRLDRVLGRRGAQALEITSLLGLIVVLVLVGIELTFTLDPRVSRSIAVVDAAICTFFVLEFVFKLALAPARLSWFARNVATDLLPAIPAAMLFLAWYPGAAEAVLPLRLLRFLRITWFARYIAAMRPALGVVRVVLFLAKGLDSLVRRFSPLLNRDFVLFEPRAQMAGPGLLPPPEPSHDPQALAWRALRREHVLLSDLPLAAAEPCLRQRAERLRERLASAPVAVSTAPRAGVATVLPQAREVAIEEVIAQLHALRPEELPTLLARREIRALDRVVRVINAPVVRALPFLRRLSFRERLPTPEERVVRLGARIADWLEAWRRRALAFADLHGVVTGPQILDRVATAMVKASQRPAVRLLLFGALFFIVRAVVGEDSAIGGFLKRFVATPLVVLGSVCLVVLWLGRWMKSLAGEAAEAFKLTSEAHFVSLLELQKQRNEEADLAFLARRTFRGALDPLQGAWALSCRMHEIRTGRRASPPMSVPLPANDVDRLALLYLHFLDGGVLHVSDVKTTEQLLANLSLENVRHGWLRWSKKQRKQLRTLSLTEGSLLRGPYMWFQFITESVAVETAKRITDWNRHCLSLLQRRVVSPERLHAADAWLAAKRGEAGGRTLQRLPPPGPAATFATTEFHALDFLTVDEAREQHLERTFGAEVVTLLRHDRRRMIREIFGSKPLHRLPRSRRTVNAYVLYQARLSRGRIFLLPLVGVRLFLRAVRMVAAKVVGIVREILAPQKALQQRESGEAPFAAALRKIHRMKAPGCLEAMRLRAAFDPAYSGAPCGWSGDAHLDEVPELERDMSFLGLDERDRRALRRVAERNRTLIGEWVQRTRTLPQFPRLDAADLAEDEDSGLERAAAECAVVVAWMTDARNARTLLQAANWLERELPRLAERGLRLPPRPLLAGWQALRRRFRPHPVDVWIATRLRPGTVTPRARRNLKRLWRAADRDLRRLVRAWLELPPGVDPAAEGLQRLRDAWREHRAVHRELAAVRAVQSLSILEVRNYRSVVFRLGEYAADGEDPALAEALP